MRALNSVHQSQVYIAVFLYFTDNAAKQPVNKRNYTRLLIEIGAIVGVLESLKQHCHV